MHRLLDSPVPDNWTSLPAPLGLFLLEAPPAAPVTTLESLPGFLFPHFLPDLVLPPRYPPSPSSRLPSVVCVTCIPIFVPGLPFFLPNNFSPALFIMTTRDRVRDREDRERRAQQAQARTNEYFVPKDGIDREVITADICRYLGNDALVRPGQYEVGHRRTESTLS